MSRPGSGIGAARTGAAAAGAWTFLTNHAHVLLCLAAEPDLTVEGISRRVGITERSARRIIGELEEARYVARTRVGRNNRYALDASRPLRHDLERHRTVGALIEMVYGPRGR